jgi:hypothetical protein
VAVHSYVDWKSPIFAAGALPENSQRQRDRAIGTLCQTAKALKINTYNPKKGMPLQFINSEYHSPAIRKAPI